MNHAALSCKVVSSSVIVVREFLARTISSGGNSRLALATADNFDGAMIYCDCQNLLFSEQYCELPRHTFAESIAHDTTFVVYKCALVINKGKFIERACIKSGI